MIGPTPDGHRDKAKFVVLDFLAIVIALGEYAEAVSLVTNAVDVIERKLTNKLEYETLSKFHVGNTRAYTESLVGVPQMSRQVNENVVANYFYLDKDLLTVFYHDQQLVAYLVLPLLEGFSPQVPQLAAAGVKGLCQFHYHDSGVVPASFSLDNAKTNSYYLESIDGGYAGLLSQTYLANLNAAGTTAAAFTERLYQQQVFGEDAQTAELLQTLRKDVTPNVYGEGVLSLEQFARGLLTPAELKAYFGVDA